MALITCPECGEKISDKASHCIHCGYPLKPKNYMATFKMPVMEGVTTNPKIQIFNAKTGQLLAESRPGGVVKFKVDKPMTIRFKMWGGWDNTFDLEPIPNAKYNFFTKRAFFGWSPLVLQRVDVIDSD